MFSMAMIVREEELSFDLQLSATRTDKIRFQLMSAWNSMCKKMASRRKKKCFEKNNTQI